MVSKRYAGVDSGLFLCNNVRDIKFISKGNREPRWNGITPSIESNFTCSAVSGHQGILLFPGWGGEGWREFVEPSMY